MGNPNKAPHAAAIALLVALGGIACTSSSTEATTPTPQAEERVPNPMFLQVIDYNEDGAADIKGFNNFGQNWLTMHCLEGGSDLEVTFHNANPQEPVILGEEIACTNDPVGVINEADKHRITQLFAEYGMRS